MLNYKILLAKPTIYKNTGDGVEEIKDLLSPVLSDEHKTLYNGRVVQVEADYICRPDLVSLAVYGSDEYADILCKLNGISNPFELNEGMLLYIPDISYIYNFVKRGNPCPEVKNESDNLSSAKKTNQKKKNEKRSPAEQIIGENTFIIDKSLGIVYY